MLLEFLPCSVDKILSCSLGIWLLSVDIHPVQLESEVSTVFVPSQRQELEVPLQ